MTNPVSISHLCSHFSWLSLIFFHFLSECIFGLFVRSELLHRFIFYEKLDCSSLGLVWSVQVVWADGWCLSLSHVQYFLWQRFNTAANIDLCSCNTVGWMQQNKQTYTRAAVKHWVERNTCWQGFSFPSQFPSRLPAWRCVFNWWQARLMSRWKERLQIHLLPAELSKNSFTTLMANMFNFL